MIWRFRATGRDARVLSVSSTRDTDIVWFRFLDEPPTSRRRVVARQFLVDFVRIGQRRG